MEENQVRLPDRGRFDNQPIIIRDGLLGKIGMGLLCSTIVAIVMNFAGLRWLVVHIFALFLGLFGKGEYVVKPADAVKAEVKARADEARQKYGIPTSDEAKAAAGRQAVGGIVPVAVPGLKSEAEREADRQRKETAERNKFIARADAAGLEYDDDWTLEKFKVEVPLAEQRARDAAERKPLLAQAKELKMAVDDDWDNKTLKEEIKEEKAFQRADTDYQEAKRRYQEAKERYDRNLATGPNARCPNPRCGHTMRFSAARINTKFVCAKCAGIFPVRQAVACWTPPPPPKEPLPPKRKPSLIKRIFG